MTANSAHKLTVLPVYDRVEDEQQCRARAGTVVDTDAVVTFSRLIDALAQSGVKNAAADAPWAGSRFASTAELAVVRRRVVEDARQATAPEHKTLLMARGLPRLLSGFFDACAEGRVEPTELSQFVRETPQTSSRLVLLAELYQKYRTLLCDSGLLDDTDRLRIAEEAAGDDVYPLPPLLEGVGQVEIRDIFDWTAARLTIVTTLANRLMRRLGPPERVCLQLPYSHRGQNLFHHMERALREMEGQTDVPIEVVFCALEESDRPPARVGSLLFQDDEVCEPSEVISFTATPGEEQEIRSVARTVLSLLRRGIMPDDIAIALRQPESDWRRLADQLDAYGVPWRYRRGARLSETPLFRHVNGLLEAVVDGLPRDAMVRLLTSAFSPRQILIEEPATSAGPPSALEDSDEGPVYATDDRVAAVLKAAGVRDLVTGAEGSRTGYHVRLQSYLARVRPRPTAIPAESIQGELFSPTGPDRHVRWYAQQERQVRAILSRVEALRALERDRSVTDWANSLARLLRQADFDPHPSLANDRMAAPSSATPTRLDQRTLSARALNQQSMLALERILRELAQSPESKHIALGPGGFRSLLSEIAQDVSLHPTGARGAAVAIVSIRQLTGAGYRHVFIPHVNEGSFPASPRIDPLFKDWERTAFNRWRRSKQPGQPVFSAFPIEEPQPDDERVPVRRSEETLLLALALGACKERAHISWSTRDPVGRPQLPSLFVDALQAVTAAVETTEGLEILPGADRLVTAAELTELSLCRAGLSLDGVDSEAWQHVARYGRDQTWWDDLANRCWTDLARTRFFESSDGDEQLRTSGPDTVEPDLWRYLGYVDEDALTDWLVKERLPFGPDKPASATRFERYGQCPARFFFQDVLGIQPDERVHEEMDASAKGTLLHEVADLLYDEVIATGAKDIAGFLQRIGDDSAREALLDQLMKDSVSKLEREKHFGHPQLLALAWRQLRQLLLQALDGWSKDGVELGGIPYAREWVFGYEGKNALEVPLGDGRVICFKGRIDRVDRLATGELLVTDYKLGKGKGPSYTKKIDAAGRHRVGFQLSLYALAVMQRFEDQPPSGVKVQYFGFGDRKTTELSWDTLSRVLGTLIPEPLGRDEELLEGELSLRAGVEAVVDGIFRGCFPAATRDCSFCDFSALCRVSNRVKNGGWSP